MALFPSSSTSSFSPLKLLPSDRDALHASAPVAHGLSGLSSSLSPDGQAGSSSPSLEDTWTQPHGQQSIGEEKVTLYLPLGPKREDKSSFKKKKI